MNLADHLELSVCTVCLHLLANGEFNDGTNAAELAATGMQRLWGATARHLVADGEQLGFSTWSCDTCGDTGHGDRYRAIALIPQSGGAT